MKEAVLEVLEKGKSRVSFPVDFTPFIKELR